MIKHEDEENASNKVMSSQENTCCIILDDASTSITTSKLTTDNKDDDGYRCDVDLEKNFSSDNKDDDHDKHQRRCCSGFIRNWDVSLMKCIVIDVFHFCRILMLIVTTMWFSRYMLSSGNASNVGITFRLLIIFFWTTYELRYCILRLLKLNDIDDDDNEEEVEDVRNNLPSISKMDVDVCGGHPVVLLSSRISSTEDGDESATDSNNDDGEEEVQAEAARL